MEENRNLKIVGDVPMSAEEIRMARELWAEICEKEAQRFLAAKSKAANEKGEKYA